MLRRGALALVLAAGLFFGSLAAGFLLAGVSLRHSAGAGLTAAPFVPRPAGQLGSPVASPGPATGGTAGPDARSGVDAGSASGPASTAAPSAGALRPAAPALTPPAGDFPPAAAGNLSSGGAPGPVRTPGPAAPGAVTVTPAPPTGDTSIIIPVTAPDAPLPPGATPLPPAARAPVPPPMPGRFHVQVGAFDERQNADALAIRLRAGGYAATVTDGPPFRVWVGGYLDRATAERLAAGLKDLGLTPELVTQ
ncbi:MAG TPA: SPOR domain-containing protein [bacterium]|nr:SPOR domain-containing protein [bacterium]